MMKQCFHLFINKEVALTSGFDCCFCGNTAMVNNGADAPEKMRSVNLKACQWPEVNKYFFCGM